MTNELTTFAYNTASIRVIKIDGEPWFCGSDVLKVLYETAAGKANAYKAIAPDQKTKVNRNNFGMGKGPEVYAISESGLYKIIMRSDKPEAKAFQDWVTREVLPSIRKTGGYHVEQPQQQPAPEAAAPLTPMEHMMKALDHAMQASFLLMQKAQMLEAELVALQGGAPRFQTAQAPHPRLH